MTIERARQILGQEVISLSDQEVTNLIYTTGQFADTLLDVVVDSFTTGTQRLTKGKRKDNNGDSN